ncbi:hypothetical protein D3C87_1554040 [compost metagenome]
MLLPMVVRLKKEKASANKPTPIIIHFHSLTNMIKNAKPTKGTAIAARVPEIIKP